MSSTNERYELYRQKMRTIADVRHANAVLQWDQETYLPPKGADKRGQQLSTLSEISHGLFSADELGGLLEELLQRNDLSYEERRNVELTQEDYVRNKKYSSSFVRALSEQTHKAFHAWIEARRQNSFSVFEKALDGLITLKREEAQLLGFEGHPYNALLNEFEKGCTVSLLDKTFEGVLPSLRQLLERIRTRPQVDDAFLRQHYPKQQQWDWGMHLIKQLHFDFEAGRQDLSEHPFSTSFNRSDVRITTRVDESDFGNMTWSCIHETGHALYEQGLPDEHYGLPLSEACSYSIHESQSRLWENHVGRSLPFWEEHFGSLRDFFPQQLGPVDVTSFYRGINKVTPSLVRTEADEITYHFHVFIRYELEKRLLDGSLSTRDIPGFWNDQYRQLLGVEVPDDKRGCLQDVHWSHGSFGYFPTYSLGSFYAAQFHAAAQKALGSNAQQDTAALLHWLRSRIHYAGRRFTSEELCQAVTGETLNVAYFSSYLLDKYVSIYTL